MDLALPHNGWLPRKHQIGLWRHLREAAASVRLRFGTGAPADEICLHHAAVSAATDRKLLALSPEYLQGRKAIWTAINPHSGKRRIDRRFRKLRASTNDNEMFIRLRNHSTCRWWGATAMMRPWAPRWRG
jgi:hypothetical protein